LAGPNTSGICEDIPLFSHSLADLGWSADFLRQLDLDEIGRQVPARIAAVHRDRLEALTEGGPVTLTLPSGLPTTDIAVGDWVLSDPETGRVTRVLDRRSLIARRSAGTGADRQLIAANLDTLAILTSCNAEFSEARLERYLALARSGGVTPLVVLTKADATDAAPFVARAGRVARGAAVVALDARAAGVALADWTAAGQTICLAGSSGVGKSTLAASLTGVAMATAGIREDDGKGRHTTTHRQLIRIPGGGWLMDTPGMRELRLADAADGIALTFDDIDGLAQACRFGDCRHEAEPGCAVQAAIRDGALDPGRLSRWGKLMREDRYNSETLAEAHARNRAFGRLARDANRWRKDRQR
jgi:ribosome biogenesis GTPase / thiamine phosphate phosphatase